MYCGQCGKKVMENMLFCPFCGSPIVIPEQDEPEQMPVAPAQPAAQEEPAAQPVREETLQMSLFDVPEAEEEPAEDETAEVEIVQENFEPLRFSFDDETEEAEEETVAETGDEIIIVEAPQDAVPEQETVQEQAETAAEEAEKPESIPPLPQMERSRPPRRPQPVQQRTAKTYIPLKDVDPDNLFMDEQEEVEDEYDLVDDYDSGFEDEFEFEEREEGGFFQRHIRGIVGLILLLVVAMIVTIWAFSPKGQTALARVNLAWDAETYADLGYDSFQQQSYLLAARYYEKALARDPENYDYAHSSMVAYYEADKTESAASMLKKCVEMRPDSVEAYQEMLILYPDPANRPWEITELVRMGYERTGDASLKID